MADHMGNESIHLHFIDQSQSHDDSYKSHDNTQFKKKQVSAILLLPREKIRHI